jgi:tetratricopeptide (TPR) repeat protein
MRRFGTAYLCAGLFAMTVAAYLPLWHCDFVDLDDTLYITGNPNVIGGLSSSGCRWAWTNLRAGYWQPVSWMSLQFDAHFFSSHTSDGRTILSARAFHLDNLCWHCGSSLLLFTWLQRVTAARWRSFLVAALFGLHPLHVESVAWAAERKDVLSVFFGILTLWAYVHYAAEPGWRRYLLMAAVYTVSLLCKPMLMTLPFVLLLLDYWPLRRTAPVRLALEKLPLLALAAACAVITLLSREASGGGVSLERLPLSARLANAGTAYGWYLLHTVWPGRLTVLYLHPVNDWSPWAVGAGVGALVSLTVLAVWQRRRRPWLLVGWLWFAGSVVPVIGLTQGGDQAWGDRFTYWPHIGLFIAAIWGLAELVERLHLRAAVSGTVGALVLGCLGALTWLQAGYWHDTETLWEHALTVSDANHRAHCNLGLYDFGHGRLDAAEGHFAEAVHLRPSNGDYHYYLGVVLLALGKENDAAEQLQEAVRRLEEAAERRREPAEQNPNLGNAWQNLGMIRLEQGQPEVAAACFRKVLELQPEAADARAGLGRALWTAGRRSEAVELFQDALRRDPNEPDAWHGLGVAYLTQDDRTKALEALNTAVRLRPYSVMALSDLGVALDRDGQWVDAAARQFAAIQNQDQRERRLESMNRRATAPESIPRAVILQCRWAYALDHRGDHAGAKEAYNSAVRRDKRWPEKFAAKAWRLATDANPDVRDPQQAYELASQAVQGVAEPSAALLDTLAAAQAAAGKFLEAVRTAQQALDKAPTNDGGTLAASIREHLRLYQQGQPVIADAP